MTSDSTPKSDPNFSASCPAGSTMIRVFITDNCEREVGGQMRVQTWTPREKTIRALKRLGLCWGLAVPAVFIPVLHFLLVPALVIAGPISALWAWKESEWSPGGTGLCPSCRHEIRFESGRARLPRKEVCPHCRQHLTLSRAV